MAGKIFAPVFTIAKARGGGDAARRRVGARFDCERAILHAEMGRRDKSVSWRRLHLSLNRKPNGLRELHQALARQGLGPSRAAARFE